MSNAPRTAHSTESGQNCMGNFLSGIRTLCGCVKGEEIEAEQTQEIGIRETDEHQLSLHAVDSVYMRRIVEEASSLKNVQIQQNEQLEILDSTSVSGKLPIFLHRRKKQKLVNLQVLEKALKEYESKNKTIISNTRMPNISSFNKTKNISRATQTNSKHSFNTMIDSDNVSEL